MDRASDISCSFIVLPVKSRGMLLVISRWRVSTESSCAMTCRASSSSSQVKAKIAELDHWTDKQETKAEVDTLIGRILWEELPESYSDNAFFAYR